MTIEQFKEEFKAGDKFYIGYDQVLTYTGISEDALGLVQFEDKYEWYWYTPDELAAHTTPDEMNPEWIRLFKELAAHTTPVGRQP